MAFTFCPNKRSPIIPGERQKQEDTKKAKWHKSLIWLTRFYFLRFYFFTFRKKGRETGINCLSLPLACMYKPLGTEPATWACALTRNQTCFAGGCFNQLSHTGQGNTLLSCSLNHRIPSFFMYIDEFLEAAPWAQASSDGEKVSEICSTTVPVLCFCFIPWGPYRAHLIHLFHTVIQISEANSDFPEISVFLPFLLKVLVSSASHSSLKSLTTLVTLWTCFNISFMAFGILITSKNIWIYVVSSLTVSQGSSLL